MSRISLSTLQATGMGFFGLYGSTAALATTLADKTRAARLRSATTVDEVLDLLTPTEE